MSRSRVTLARTLAAAMESTLDAPPPRDMLIQRARDFSVERVADAYLDVMGMR